MPDWNKVYAEKSASDAVAASVLQMHIELLPKQGRALDYASGLGGNAQLLAAHGLQADAYDLSPVAMDKLRQYADETGLPVDTFVLDLEQSPLTESTTYDVIVVSYFLHRNSLRMLADLLKPGGLLFYQTFSGEPFEQCGPSRPEFRLARGELLEVFKDLQLLFYREYDAVCDGWVPGQVQFVARKNHD